MTYYIMKLKVYHKYIFIQIYCLKMNYKNIKEDDILSLLYDISLMIIKNINIILDNHHFINDIINYNIKLVNDMIIEFYDFNRI